MNNLAVLGGNPAVVGAISRFNSIGEQEIAAAKIALRHGPLSGFLGGEQRGGICVRALENHWAAKFKVNHAIACNSATSGLLAACQAIQLQKHENVVTSPYTMSATSAAPAFFGAKLKYADVSQDTYNMTFYNTHNLIDSKTSALIVPNIFGQPAELRALRAEATAAGIYMIEDNSQSPFAMEDGKYAGTIGHIGVFSLNVHKHIQCGEGGIVVTNSDQLAERIRGFINHGEMAGQGIGLNLRMTEVTAAIANAQLNRADAIISGRQKQAEKLTALVDDIPWIDVPMIRNGCTHVYYLWPIQIDTKEIGLSRKEILSALGAEGVPMVPGYVEPLYRLPVFRQFASDCPVADDLHDRSLAYFSNCEWSPTDDQLEQIGAAFKKIERQRDYLRAA